MGAAVNHIFEVLFRQTDGRMDSETETHSESRPQGHSVAPRESSLYYLLISSKPPPRRITVLPSHKTWTRVPPGHTCTSTLFPAVFMGVFLVVKIAVQSASETLCLRRRWTHVWQSWTCSGVILVDFRWTVLEERRSELAATSIAAFSAAPSLQGFCSHNFPVRWGITISPTFAVGIHPDELI